MNADAQASSEAASASGSAADWAPWLDRDFARLRSAKAHALLVEAPAGLGQWPLILATARAWLCEADESERPDGHACGRCTACDLLSAHTHPDLHVLMPEATALHIGWPLSETAQADIDDKKRKPSKEIRADDTLALVAFSQRTQARKKGKVALVYPAERMNSTSANALLKVLEEPPGALRFLLASEGSAPLLPTIRSRCQSWQLGWPKATESHAWLVARGLSTQDAAVWLRASGGRAQAALELHGQASAQLWRNLPERVSQGDVQVLVEIHGGDPASWIRSLQKLCHDRLAQHWGAASRFFAADDLGKSQPLLPRLLRWSSELRQHALQAHHPLKPELLLELLGVQARVAHSRPQS